MTRASIPVDIKDPGQVLACVGFLEAVEVLCGGVEAYFDWSGAPAQFVLIAEGDNNSFEVVLDFLSTAEVVELTPITYVEGGAADGDDEGEEDATAAEIADGAGSDDSQDATETSGRITTEVFPSGEGNRNSLPIQLVRDGKTLAVSHFADGSSRDDFKLYSGNRSATAIAKQMLQGVPAKRKKGQANGDLRYRGVRQLWQEQRDALLNAPFDVITPMGGSFSL